MDNFPATRQCPWPRGVVRIALIVLGVLLLAPAAGPLASSPSPQAIAPPPVSQRVRYLGQTGGVVTDFIIQDSLIFVPEGDALTILQRSDPPTVLSRTSPNQGRIQGIALSEGTVFAITPIGLAAIDVHDPLNPAVVSFMPGGGEAVKLADGFAFIAARAAGLRIVNVADPRRPVLAGTFPLPGKALALELDPRASLAYVAADEGGLRVVDVGAPDVPREITSLTPAAGVQQVGLGGNLLSLSSGDRILLLDVSQPGALVQAGEYAPPRLGRRVRWADNYAYIADLDGGLKVFDLSNPARPLLIYAETGGSSLDVAVRGNRLFLADGPAGVRIISVANPARPQLIAHLPLDPAGAAQGLDLWEDWLLVAAGEAGFYLVNIANERAPVVLGHLDTEGDARDVKTDGNLAYLADGPAGLAVISLAFPWEPELRGTFFAPGEAHALGIVGTFVYIAAGDGGLVIVDAIRPAAPYLVGELALPDGQQAVDVAMVAKRAYLAIQGDQPEETGLVIADVGFRSQPSILSRVPGPGIGVAVQGTDLITVGGTELMTVDARASSGPVLLGHYRPPVGAGGMDWDGHTLYLTSAGSGAGLTLLDLSDPARPRERFNWELNAAGGQVTIAEGQTFLAAGRQGLRLLNLANCDQACPTDPAEEIVYDPMDTLVRLAAFPDDPGQVYGAGEEGWSITGVPNPSLPQPLTRVETGAPVHGLARQDNRLYAATAARGLLIYDVSDAQRPQLLGRWAVSTPLRDVLVHEGYLYLADWRTGLQVVDPNPPERPVLLQTLPLPGTPEQIITLTGGLAYVRAGEAGLRLVELGSPSAGVKPMGQFPADVATIQWRPPFAITLDGGSFAVWQLPADVSSRQVLQAEPVASFRVNGTGLLLAPRGDRAFVGSDAGHVTIIDLSNPAEPHILGMMGNGAAVKGMATHGDYLIVGLQTIPRPDQPQSTPRQGLLRVWDVSNPRQPEEVNLTVATQPFAVLAQPAGKPQRLLTAGSHLTVYDFSQPLTATMIAELPLPSPAASLHLAGDLAYVGTEQELTIAAGLEVDAPYLLGEYPFGRAVNSVELAGTRGYLAVEGVGGVIMDLSNPAEPNLIAYLPAPTGMPLQRLHMSGDRLWAVWDDWVSWMDVSSPRPGPHEIAGVPLDGLRATDLTVVANRAYLTDADTGLHIYDISDPAAPRLLGQMDTPGQALAATVSANGETAYLADGECGLRVASLSGDAPVEVGYWHTGYALDVVAMEDKIYVADIGELMALAFDPAGSPVKPPAPQLPQPADGTSFYLPDTTLLWGPPTTACDPLSYDLYLGLENPPPLLATGLTSPTFTVSGLERRQTYYWQVVAHDRQGDTTAGPVWQFHVRTAAQPPPTPTVGPRPQLPPPEQNAVLPVIGGLAATGLALGAIWWAQERRRS